MATPLLVRRTAITGLRNLTDTTVELGEGINVAFGDNGAGKTNLLEGLALSLTGRSPRTRNDREILGFGKKLVRVETAVGPVGDDEEHEFLYAFDSEGNRRHLADGSPVGLESLDLRPPVAVFMPDRLALVKGTPAARRAHLDRFWMALWPARGGDRGRFAQALAQRNALLGRVSAGYAPPADLDAWDHELALAAEPLVANRAAALAELAEPFAVSAGALGLDEASLEYRPRVEPGDIAGYTEALLERRDRDIARGFSTHGPHLDEVRIALGPRQIRNYGSQGQQRLALLALLFAEREVLIGADRPPPLMLLDDVTSELDGERRELLFRLLSENPGQALLTTTGLDQVPEPSGAGPRQLRVSDGKFEIVDAGGST